MTAILFLLSIVGFIVGETWSIVAACALVALGAYGVGRSNGEQAAEDRLGEDKADAYLKGWSTGYDQAIEVVKASADHYRYHAEEIAVASDVRPDEVISVLNVVFGNPTANVAKRGKRGKW
jgi:hypothetical protein